MLVAIAGVLVPAGSAHALPLDALDRSSVAVTSMTANRLDVFTRGADGSLHHKSLSDGKWSGWDDLGGLLTSAPTAASWANGRIDVFGRGAAGDLQHIWYINGVWSAWESLGGYITSAPTVASWGSNRLDTFARGEDNTLNHLAWSGKWNSWESLGGVLTSAPAAASWGSNHIDVFFRGAGNDLQRKYWLGSWSGFSSLGGTITSAPTAVSWGANRLDVFATGANGSLEQKWYNGAWQPWANLGGTSASAPAAASWAANRLDIFQVTDTELQQKTYSGVWPWSQWSRLAPLEPKPQFKPDTPIAAYQSLSSSTNRPIHYAFVDNLGRLLHGTQADPEDYTNVAWTIEAGLESFTGPPYLAEQADGEVNVLAQKANGDILLQSPTGTRKDDLGGWSSAPPTSARFDDGRLVLFSVDAEGRLWSKTQAAANGAFSTWLDLGDVDLTSPPIATFPRLGKMQLYAIDVAGVLRTATYEVFGAISAWTALSEPGLTGTPAVVPYAIGGMSRVYVRDADGAILTTMQESDGTFKGVWERVGTFVAAGSPSAVIPMIPTRDEIVARGEDGMIYKSGQSGASPSTWLDWTPALVDSDGEPLPIVAANDPTAFEINRIGIGSISAFVFRDIDGRSYVTAVSYGDEAGTPNETGPGGAGPPIFITNPLKAPTD